MVTPGPSNFGTPSQSQSRSPAPSASGRASARHGSAAEVPPRDVFGRDASSFKSREMPRTPRRARSPGDENDRERDRGRSQQDDGKNPVGMAFRVNAIEQTLREHHQELLARNLANQKNGTDMVEMHAWRVKIGGLVDDLMSFKTNVEARLDVTFKEWNLKISQLEKSHATEDAEAKVDRDVIRSVVQAISLRIDAIDIELAKPRSRPEAFDIGGSPPGTPPNGAPTMPNTWSPLNPNVGQAPTAGATAGGQPDPWAQYSQGQSMGGAMPQAAPQPQTQPQPMPGAWSAGFGTNTGPFHEKDWAVSEKVSRELKSFDGPSDIMTTGEHVSVTILSQLMRTTHWFLTWLRRRNR